VYALENHCSCDVDACKSLASVGSATVKTVLSSPTVSMATASAPRAHQRFDPVARLTAHPI
jgi:hypothetical protein